MKYKFADLTINSSALNCPNPQGFYAKAYLGMIDPKYFRVIPGVKNTIKLSNLTFQSLLKAEDCAFNASASVLSATTYSVCPLQLQVEICKTDLEQSYVSQEMKAGSMNWNVPSFMNYYWDTLQEETAEELQNLMFNGDITGATGTYLDLCDGYHKRLMTTAGVLRAVATAVTVANVVSLIGEALMAAPAAIVSNRKNLVIYAASNVVTAYRIATNAYNTAAGITGDLPVRFNNIEIVEIPAMANNRMIVTLSTNMLYLMDGEGDSAELKAIDLSETTAQKVLRTAASLKVGFYITNPTQIVYRY